MDEGFEPGPIESALMIELNYEETMNKLHSGTHVANMGDFVGRWD